MVESKFIMVPTPIVDGSGKHIKRFRNNWKDVIRLMVDAGYRVSAVVEWMSYFGYSETEVRDVVTSIEGSVVGGSSEGEVIIGKELSLEDWEFLQKWMKDYEGVDIDIPVGMLPVISSGGNVTDNISVVESGSDSSSGEAIEFSVAGPGEVVGQSTAVVETVEEREAKVRSLVADPLPVFEQLNTYTLMVAQGLSNALLVTGMGGVGKSYNVNRILSAYGKKGRDYVVMKGKSSISAMYKFLYDNYDKIVVFDDCDSVLEDTDGLNILKGVLDSVEVREVSWNTSGPKMVDTFGCETHEEIEKALDKFAREHKKLKADLIPNYFRFMGSCIFISNMSVAAFQRKAAMAPLLTRCTTVDIQLSPEEVITKIEAALPGMHIYNTKGVDITNEDIKVEVFDYIRSDEFLKDSRIEGKPLSFRCFINAYKFRLAGLPNWKDLSFSIS